MPSIPQSLLWISLVVLWLFVLVPMLVGKRDAVRRTSDVALATRVLNTTRRARLIRRAGPAAGHRSDPDWQPSDEDVDDSDDVDDEIAMDEPTERSVIVAAAVVADVEPEAAPEADELTLDLEDSEDTEAVDEAQAAQQAAEPAPEADDADDEYTYVEDSSGLEAPSDSELRIADSMSAARRRRHESKTAAVVSARKFQFRKRMLLFMAVTLTATATAAYTVAPWAWWACGSLGAVTMLYLGYLRRQTRIEERLRRRRAQRMVRSRLGVENTDDSEFDLVPSRLRRPGAVVLEIDDEDPVFEHLEYAPSARDYHLPRAAGQ